MKFQIRIDGLVARRCMLRDPSPMWPRAAYRVRNSATEIGAHEEDDDDEDEEEEEDDDEEEGRRLMMMGLRVADAPPQYIAATPG